MRAGGARIKGRRRETENMAEAAREQALARAEAEPGRELRGGVRRSGLGEPLARPRPFRSIRGELWRLGVVGAGSHLAPLRGRAWRWCVRCSSSGVMRRDRLEYLDVVSIREGNVSMTRVQESDPAAPRLSVVAYEWWLREGMGDRGFGLEVGRDCLHSPCLQTLELLGAASSQRRQARLVPGIVLGQRGGEHRQGVQRDVGFVARWYAPPESSQTALLFISSQIGLAEVAASIPGPRPYVPSVAGRRLAPGGVWCDAA